MTRNGHRVRWHRDDGVTTVETLLWVGVAVFMLGLAMFVVRGASAAIDAGNAADAAARAASLQNTPQAATRAAQTVAAADLAAADSACRAPRTHVDVTAFHPGGTVTVTVTCTVTVADLPVTGISGKTITATASAPLDVYKVVTP